MCGEGGVRAVRTRGGIGMRWEECESSQSLANLKIPNHTTLRPGLSSVSKQGTGALKCLTKLQVHTWFTPSKSFGAKQPSLLTSQPNKPSVALRCEKLSQLWSFVWSSALHGRDRLAGMIDDDDLFVRSLADDSQGFARFRNSAS